MRTRRSAAFGTFRMKQISVFPMVIMLIAIILLIIWLRPQ